MMAWKSGFATVSGLALGLYSLINRELSPLFWVLLGALFLDLILNWANEAAVVQKLVKAAAATILPVTIKMLGGQSGIHNLHTYLIAAVAVITLLVLDGVIPQLLTRMSAASKRFGLWLGVRYLPEVQALTKIVETDVKTEGAKLAAMASDQAQGH